MLTVYVLFSLSCYFMAHEHFLRGTKKRRPDPHVCGRIKKGMCTGAGRNREAKKPSRVSGGRRGQEKKAGGRTEKNGRKRTDEKEETATFLFSKSAREKDRRLPPPLAPLFPFSSRHFLHPFRGIKKSGKTQHKAFRRKWGACYSRRSASMGFNLDARANGQQAEDQTDDDGEQRRGGNRRDARLP